MLQNSTGTLTSIFVAAAFTVVPNGNTCEILSSDIRPMYQTNYNSADTSTSGMHIPFYSHNNVDFVRSNSCAIPVDTQSIIMQQRHKAIEESFSKYSEGFPAEKTEYFSLLVNSLCRLQFNDNLSSFNEEDNSIDTILKLSNGLKLSISKFIDEDINAPVIFSIHRGKSLLISDEMPVEEMVDTINSIVVKLADEYKA